MNIGKSENTIVALDIINPFNKTVKMDGLKKLIERINECNAYDKVGFAFYDLEECVKNDVMPLTEYVYNWLKHLDSLRGTKKLINFTMDLS